MRGRIFIIFFFASDNFQGTFVDFRFMMFTQALINKLAHISIHVLKIFNCRVSFKMLLSMHLEIVKKELWIQLWPSNFQDGIFEKITITLVEVVLIQVSFPNVSSKQKIKMNTRYTMIFLYKSQVYSKHGSIVFLLFGSWNLVLYLQVLTKAKLFLITLTCKLS